MRRRVAAAAAVTAVAAPSVALARLKRSRILTKITSGRDVYCSEERGILRQG